MPMTQPDGQLTAGQLLKAVGQMPPAELDRFVEQVVVLRASQRAPRLSQAEAEQLAKINRGLDTEDQHRFDQLAAQREMQDLTEGENAELVRLAELSEMLNVERMEALAELAQLRSTTLRAVMQDLGIKTAADA